MKLFFKYVALCILIYIIRVKAISQHPEINDQFENTTKVSTNNEPNTINEYNENDNVTINEIQVIPANKKANESQYEHDVQTNFITKLYNAVKKTINKFLLEPKISTVLRNVGVCTVNGVMEIISYYFPAPVIPLIASAAGMIIPFEPVVMLKEKMPVTSYRRAIKTAVNSFLGTFDKYKVSDDFDDDPYMTRRFNRRFMNTDRKNKI